MMIPPLSVSKASNQTLKWCPNLIQPTHILHFGKSEKRHFGLDAKIPPGYDLFYLVFDLKALKTTRLQA